MAGTKSKPYQIDAEDEKLLTRAVTNFYARQGRHIASYTGTDCPYY